LPGDLPKKILNSLATACVCSRSPRNARKPASKLPDVAFQDLRRVALRVEGDEDALHPFAVLAQRLLHFRQLHHRRRADVGALGVAEEEHHGLALEFIEAAQATLDVGQREASADSAPVTSVA
jgi:hypothetical protein